MGESAAEVLAREHDQLEEAFARIRDEGADRVAAWHEAVRRMASHVAVERTFVYPLVRSRHLGSSAEAGSHLAEQLRRHYSRMEHLLVLTERRKLNSPDMPSLVTELMDVFEMHVQLCAAVLIPAMRERLDPGELDALGTRMRAAEHVIVSHPHPHLLALGPVYPWTTRAASWWDRVRDRTVSNR